MPNRSWDANVWVSDNRKIRAQLGWQPRSTFAEGFRLMVDWFRQGPPPCYAAKPPGKAGLLSRAAREGERLREPKHQRQIGHAKQRSPGLQY